MFEGISNGFALMKSTLGWVWIPILIVVAVYLFVKFFGRK
jgi:hypothetical protein